MKYFSILLPFLIFLTGCGGTIQDQPKVASDKQQSNRTLAAICGADLQSGSLAVKMRSQGSSRDFLQQAVNAIPDSKARKKKIMNAALTDAFAHPSLPQEAYGMYRLEACYFEMAGKKVPEFLNQEMASNLVQCESLSPQKAKYLCASAIAKNYSQ